MFFAMKMDQMVSKKYSPVKDLFCFIVQLCWNVSDMVFRLLL